MGKVQAATALSALLMFPFFGWGVYTLRVRLNQHLELSPGIEAATLGALLLFYTFEFALLQVWLGKNHVVFAASALALVFSGLALYGPMLSSLLSHTVTGMLMPESEAPQLTPHFGAGEQREREGNLEAALHEYLTVNRMFPKDRTARTRVADVLLKLERFEEALPWFEALLGEELGEEAVVSIGNRMVEILDGKLGRRLDALNVLRGLQLRCAGGEFEDSIARRIERFEEPASGKGKRPAKAKKRDREAPVFLPDSSVAPTTHDDGGAAIPWERSEAAVMPGEELPEIILDDVPPARDAEEGDEDLNELEALPGIELSDLPKGKSIPHEDDADEPEELPGSELPNA